MKKRTIAIAAVGALALAGTVAAVVAQGHRGGSHGGHMMFGDDESGQGMRGRFGRTLTKDAFDTRSRERFASIDRNSDGVIDPAEIEAAMAAQFAGRMGRHGAQDGQMGQRLLRMFDASKDGKVTKEEARAEIMRRFAEMDLSRDGRIDDADLPPMLRGRNVLAGGEGMGPMMGGGKGRHDIGGHGKGGMGLLRQADTNKDGVITREEAEALADREFARFDRNKDGTVDQADFDALRKEMTDYRVKRFAHGFGAGPDGRVTREQFQAKAAERFARMDFNGDGSVSRDEMPGRGHGRRGGHGMMGHGMTHDGGPDGGMGGMGGMGRGPAPTDVPPAKQ